MTSFTTNVPVDGVISMGSDGAATLRFERRLRHSVERTWAAITRPEEIVGWLGAAEVDLRANGSYALRWLNSDSAMRGEITELDPPRLLELATDTHGVLRWELEPTAGGCRLTFTAAYPPGRSDDVELLAGWDLHLDLLADALAGNPVNDWRQWPRERWEAKRMAYEARRA